VNEKQKETRPVKGMKTADEAPKLQLMTPHVAVKRRQGRLPSSNPTHKHFNVMQRAVVLLILVGSFYVPRFVMRLVKKTIDSKTFW
jgi:hypothetical protein